MNLPPALRQRIEERFGPIRRVDPVGGGCINHAARIGLSGHDAFLKFNPDAPPGFFGVEARGLERLRTTASGLRIPEVLAAEDDGGDAPAWMLLEWLELAGWDAALGAQLGRGLAALHRVPQAAWGWGEDGFIGSLPQPNTPAESWAAFWQHCRLEPQLRRARDAGRLPGKMADWERLFARLPSRLAAAGDDGPSLLHGDLWGGNVLAVRGNGAAAEPGLVDPAVYRGHREVDLAMSELFGGFGPGFYTAYEETWPLQPGYREERRAVYQLYYLLVHVNIFGGGYGAQTAQALRDALRA